MTHRTKEALAAALREIAAFDDKKASQALERLGTYVYFDEPASVRIAREALAAYSREQGEDGWRPIETAPKDGTRFWMWFPWAKQTYAASWRLNAYDREPSWTLDDGESANQTYDPPSHWMPLPAAPSPQPTTDIGSDLCGDCPPVGYPTDETRCAPCPRRQPTTDKSER